MSDWMAIVNPQSGGTARRSRLLKIVHQLERFTDTIVFTKCPGHAAQIAMASTKYLGIAAVGGDGTLLEILKGLNRKDQRIAIIAAGRGNSLARDLGIFGEVANLNFFITQQPTLVDLMEVKYRTRSGFEGKILSASAVAFGYPSVVAHAARKFALLGRHAYVAAAATRRPLAFHVEIATENQRAQTRCLRGLVIGNTRHLANFLAFPDGSCQDGFFDVMELDAGFFRQNLHNVSALLGSRFCGPSALVRTRSAQIRLEAPQPLLIDGEIFPDVVSMDVRILPRELACNWREERG